jgi:hypothetical protein
MQKTGVVFNKDSGKTLDVDLDFAGVLHTHRPKLLASVAKTTTILLNRQARATSFSHNFLLWTAVFHELSVWGVVPTCWWTQAEIEFAGRFETPSGFGVLKGGWEHRAYLLA